MKKISKKKNLLTRAGLGVVAASLVMTPIVTAIACGTTNTMPVKQTNTFTGTFSSEAKKQEFLKIKDKVPKDAFKNEKGLISITLPDVVTIGENAFSMSISGPDNQLVEVNLPKVVTISDNAFNNANVKEIDFPNAKYLGLNLFNRTTLTSISLAGIEIIGAGTFQNYKNVTILNLPAVIEIGDHAFEDLNHLFTINLPEVLIIGQRAFDTDDIASVRTTTFSIPKVRKIGAYAFNDREIIGSIYLPLVKEIGDNAFYHSQFISIDLPILTKISTGAFELSVVTSLKIPQITNIDQIIGALSFYSIADGAEVFVNDVDYWKNSDADFQSRLLEIFGQNAPTIQWKTYTS